MSDSARTTKSDVKATAKCFTKNGGQQDILKAVLSAPEGSVANNDVEVEIGEVESLAQGGYNSRWLVSLPPRYGKDLKFIRREPTEDALLPNQIENEIGFLTYIAKNHPSIPVPRVYAYDVGSQSSTPFIAVEYIRGEPLSTAWKLYGSPKA